jgi:aminoglycoside phosphotransferase (APT) family kinase protein
LRGIQLISGGRSNLTYRLDLDGGQIVLRRPPLGHVLPTAHDMGREYRVLSALAGTAVPVPQPLASCQDPEIIGAPFYLMRYVEGLVLRTAQDGELLSPAQAGELSELLAQMLATIHGVDLAAVGLDTFGRPEGYLARQLSRWQRQWELSNNREMPGYDDLVARLTAGLPDPATAQGTLVHGDFRLDNTLVTLGEPAKIAAVVDWEMSTLGDPLVDIAVLVAYAQEATQSPYGNPDSAANAAGFPSPDELLETYARLSGCAAERLGFYLGLAFFKIAGILEGIHFRYVAGQTVGDGFDGVGVRVPWLIQAGLNAITC